MQLFDVVTTSGEVAATRSRLAKREALVALLRRADPGDVEILVAYLAGAARQRRTGLGWSSLRSLPPAVPRPQLTLQEVDAALAEISQLAGPKSGLARAEAVRDLFGKATELEQEFLRRLILGDLRQGALEAAVVEAIATASEVDLNRVRRAVMVEGAIGPVALAALTGGAEAVERFRLKVGRAVRPMLAATAPDIDAALATARPPVVVDQKLDGIRIQAHKLGHRVLLYTRSLDDITDRLPEVVEVVARLPVEEAILDGEVMTLAADGTPRPFQETAARTATRNPAGSRGVTAAANANSAGVMTTDVGAVRPFFFDCLYADGAELLDSPLAERIEVLDRIVPAAYRVPRLVPDDAAAAARFYADSVAAGQEGVVVKALDAAYDAGRRGSGWVKVKPRHTLDLVVLAVEWGSGRRRGLLSNIHLGARTDDGFVMLGKTFKGMTDEMLAWQTERFLELETHRDGHVVNLRPEQVVEVAFDGLQTSRRYPGGVALRFARVLRYRDDKKAAEADTLDTVRGLS